MCFCKLDFAQTEGLCDGDLQSVVEMGFIHNRQGSFNQGLHGERHNRTHSYVYVSLFSNELQIIDCSIRSQGSQSISQIGIPGLEIVT